MAMTKEGPKRQVRSAAERSVHQSNTSLALDAQKNQAEGVPAVTNGPGIAS
jgi:hypothetical protein